MSTSDKLNNILTAKKNIKDAIQAKGVSIPDDLPFSHYASKISEIQAGGGEIPDTPIYDNPYYVEYTVVPCDYALNESIIINDMEYRYGLPRIYTNEYNYTYTYDKVEITLLDGTKTDDLSTLAKDIKKIRLWYPENTPSVKFCGYESGSTACYQLLLTLDYIKTDNFNKMDNMFYYCSSLNSINLSNFNTSNVTNMSNMFHSCSSLTSLNLSNFNTSNVTDMGYMFSSCECLYSLVISSFNTSNVTTMNYMFQGCNALISLDLSSFNTSSVNYMQYMFQSCYKIKSLDLSNWDMSNTTSYSSMLNGTATLNHIDLSNSNNDTINKITERILEKSLESYGEIILPEDTESTVVESLAKKYWKPIGPVVETVIAIVSDLDEIVGIGNSTKLYVAKEPWYSDVDIDSFQIVSSDETIAYVNENNELVSVSYSENGVDVYAILNDETLSTKNIGISETDSYPYVIKFRATTKSPTTYNYLKINETDVYLTDMEYNSLSDIYTYDVGEPITSVRFNGNGSSSNEADNIRELVKLNISNLVDMSYMFSYCNSLTSVNFSNWEASNVTDMQYMFAYCTSLETVNLSNWKLVNATSMRNMFRECTSLVDVNIRDFNIPSVTTMQNMFYNNKLLKSINFSNVNAENLTNISNIINSSNSKITTVILSNWTANKVTSLSGFSANIENLELSNLTANSVTSLYSSFQGTSLKTLNLSNFKSNSLTSMDYMVAHSDKLESLDISGINISSLTSVFGLASNCSNLKSVNLTNFNNSNVTNMKEVFYNCSSLTSLDLSSFNTSSVTDMQSMFRGCSSLTSLNLSSFNTSNVTSMYYMFRDCSSLNSLDLSNFNTSNVTDMRYMFRGCSALETINLSNFNTSSVTQSSNMFTLVPSNVNWNYDGTNYQNWTLTEFQTGFSGTFPWNQ